MTSLFRTCASSVDEARALVAQGRVKLRWHPSLDAAPGPLPPASELQDRVEGMLLGLAIGDALGNTSESMVPSDRRRVHGWIDGYRWSPGPGQPAKGRPSDDTQMAFWTLEHLLDSGHLEPQRLGEVFARRRIYGMGSTVHHFRRNFKAGMPWTHSGDASGGNGALMRIAPVLLPQLSSPGAELWGDTLLAAHLTHDDELSNIACLAMVGLLWQLLGLREAPPARWWVQHWLAADDRYSTGLSYAARNGHPPGFRGRLGDLIRQHVEPALDKAMDVESACSIWHSGAYLLETLPSVIYILARHGDDPAQAILQAVNGTRDNDTCAAIVGAAVGALHGASALPQQWIDGLLGRTGDDDDGQVFRLLAQAGDRFGHGVSPRVRRRAAATMRQVS